LFPRWDPSPTPRSNPAWWKRQHSSCSPGCPPKSPGYHPSKDHKLRCCVEANQNRRTLTSDMFVFTPSHKSLKRQRARYAEESLLTHHHVESCPRLPRRARPPNGSFATAPQGKARERSYSALLIVARGGRARGSFLFLLACVDNMKKNGEQHNDTREKMGGWHVMYHEGKQQKAVQLRCYMRKRAAGECCNRPSEKSDARICAIFPKATTRCGSVCVPLSRARADPDVLFLFDVSEYRPH